MRVIRVKWRRIESKAAIERGGILGKSVDEETTDPDGVGRADDSSRGIRRSFVGRIMTTMNAANAQCDKR
jgi:hypothetical protein